MNNSALVSVNKMVVKTQKQLQCSVLSKKCACYCEGRGYVRMKANYERSWADLLFAGNYNSVKKNNQATFEFRYRLSKNKSYYNIENLLSVFIIQN